MLELLLGFENYLTVNRYTKNSVRSKIYNQKAFLNWLKSENIEYQTVSYTDVLAYINYCKDEQNKTITVNQKLRSIQQFYEFLEAKGEVENNPCSQIQLRGVMRRKPSQLLDWEELEEIYNNFSTKNITGKRNKTVLSLMIYQGLGAGAIKRLRLEDIELEKGIIYIPKTSRGNSRTLELKANQIIQIQQYITLVRPYLLGLTGKESELLFVTGGDSSNISNSLFSLSKALKKSSSKVTGFKQIRASVITHWLNIYSIREVQYMAGHRYVSSTEHYRTDKLNSLQKEIENLHPLN